MTAKFLFEPRDLWIGVYWDRRWLPLIDKDRRALILYVCLLPTIVLRLVFPGWGGRRDAD